MISSHAWWLTRLNAHSWDIFGQLCVYMWAGSPGQSGRFGEESLQEVPLHTNTLSLTDERHGRHPVLHTPPPLMQAAIGRGYVRPRSPAEGLNRWGHGQEGRREALADQITTLMFFWLLRNDTNNFLCGKIIAKFPWKIALYYIISYFDYYVECKEY